MWLRETEPESLLTAALESDTHRHEPHSPACWHLPPSPVPSSAWQPNRSRVLPSVNYWVPRVLHMPVLAGWNVLRFWTYHIEQWEKCAFLAPLGCGRSVNGALRPFCSACCLAAWHKPSVTCMAPTPPTVITFKHQDLISGRCWRSALAGGKLETPWRQGEKIRVRMCVCVCTCTRVCVYPHMQVYLCLHESRTGTWQVGCQTYPDFDPFWI